MYISACVQRLKSVIFGHSPKWNFGYVRFGSKRMILVHTSGVERSGSSGYWPLFGCFSPETSRYKISCTPKDDRIRSETSIFQSLVRNCNSAWRNRYHGDWRSNFWFQGQCLPFWKIIVQICKELTLRIVKWLPIKWNTSNTSFRCTAKNYIFFIIIR